MFGEWTQHSGVNTREHSHCFVQIGGKREPHVGERNKVNVGAIGFSGHSQHWPL